MHELYVIAKITPKPEFFEDAKNAISNIIDVTLAEEGCRIFELHEDQNGQHLFLYECWDSEEALAIHYDQPYTKQVFEEYKNWLAEPVSVHKLNKLK